MKKKKKKVGLFFLALTDFLLLIILVHAILFLPSFYDHNNTTVLGGKNNNSESQETQPSETEPESQVEVDYYAGLIQTPQPSYLEMCELDYVAPPVKRNRQEAIEAIKQLAYTHPAMWLILEKEELYPDEMLIALAANPEMTDYVYGYLSSEPIVTGGISDNEPADEYPLFLQWDIRWGYYSYGIGTMGTSGCGPSCLSMAVYYLTGDKSATPNAVADYSLSHHLYVDNVGTAWELLDLYPTTFGLTSSRINLSETNLKAELDKGNILICSVRPGNFTYSGHFIVIYGYDETGFKINDPKCVYRSRQTWTYEQIQNDIKRTWSIGK